MLFQNIVLPTVISCTAHIIKKTITCVNAEPLRNGFSPKWMPAERWNLKADKVEPTSASSFHPVNTGQGCSKEQQVKKAHLECFHKQTCSVCRFGDVWAFKCKTKTCTKVHSNKLEVTADENQLNEEKRPIYIKIPTHNCKQSSFMLGSSTISLGGWGCCSVSLHFLGLRASGRRAQMSFLVSAGATRLVWVSNKL